MVPKVVMQMHVVNYKLFFVRVKSVSVVVVGALFSASLCCNFSMSTKFKLSGTLFYGKSFRFCYQCRTGSIFSFNHVQRFQHLEVFVCV